MEKRVSSSALADSGNKVDTSRLRAFELFAGLEETQLADIAQNFVPTAAPAGAVIIQQGQVGKEVYLLEEGSVRVYRGETGTDGFLIDLQAPTLFGETALLDPERIRTASVKALSDVRMLTIQISAFLSILLSFPSVKENLRQMIASRR